MSKVIIVNNLVKSYVSSTETLHILRGLSFAVEAGAAAAVTGQSGSGKSTLLNILGGLDRCDEGELSIAGTDIRALGENALSVFRQKTIGFIFQFHYLLKDFTALENVMLPAYIAGVKKKEAIERAQALLEDLGLADRVKHYPSELSGGERQRVAVARAMVNEPLIILADEPTGNLDPDNSDAVSELLYGEAEKKGATLVVVTHDARVAARAKTHFSLENGVLAPAARTSRHSAARTSRHSAARTSRHSAARTSRHSAARTSRHSEAGPGGAR
jgi:lipoprotein-releasing system ATP-binding protein